MLLTMTHQSTWLPLKLSLHKGRGQKEEGLQCPWISPELQDVRRGNRRSLQKQVGKGLRLENRADWTWWQRGEL